MTFLERFGHSRHYILLRGLLQIIAFGLAVICPKLWIQFCTLSLENHFFLTARCEVQGYRFIPVSLGPRVVESLSATKLFNGHFINNCSQRVSVFVANWRPGQGNFASVGHTPEKCWVGTGFQIVPFSGPSQLSISIGGRQIPFQCRVLKHFDLAAPEITLWAACIDGMWDGIPYEPSLEQIEDAYTASDRLRTMFASNKSRWKFFRDCISFRRNPDARKQFIRFSTPLTTEWQSALSELVDFAKIWLEPK